MDIDIEPGWKNALQDEFSQEYFITLRARVREEYLAGKVYPEPKNLFAAFAECPYEKVSVVILGQDPYHGAGQAIGMSFAVSEGSKIPPSLQNIFKEVGSDMGAPLVHMSGDLTRWAKQGVLLLNATLTVTDGSPGSHQGLGWEEFTDAVIKKLSDDREHLVFILWGNFAREKGAYIDRSKHLVIESPHPSPFSAHKGFLGSKPFSKANEYLQANGKPGIDWL